MDLTTLQNIKSPNYGLRGNTPITHIVIHAMMGTMAGTQATFQNPSSQVSAHYGISREGLAVRYVDDEFSAWHVCRANPFCLGVEHEDIWSLPNCPKQLFGGCIGRLPWLTGPQQLASVDLVATLMLKYNIPIENVIGHNDPYLKQFGNTHQDPGPWFPWNNYRFLIKQALVKLQAPQNSGLSSLQFSGATNTTPNTTVTVETAPPAATNAKIIEHLVAANLPDTQMMPPGTGFQNLYINGTLQSPPKRKAGRPRKATA